jgi:hypothetical protein
MPFLKAETAKTALFCASKLLIWRRDYCKKEDRRFSTAVRQIRAGRISYQNYVGKAGTPKGRTGEIEALGGFSSNGGVNEIWL